MIWPELPKKVKSSLSKYRQRHHHHHHPKHHCHHHKVAKLSILLSEIESASVSLIVNNPGPYSSVVVDAEVCCKGWVVFHTAHMIWNTARLLKIFCSKKCARFVLKRLKSRWTTLCWKDFKLQGQGFLAKWMLPHAKTRMDRFLLWIVFIGLISVHSMIQLEKE